MFQPSQEILKKYADVLIKFALWNGNGIKKGETVSLQVPESLRPMLEALVESTLETGANPLMMLLPEGANLIGEYNSTDSRISKITRFVAETLYEENVGGRYGNTHLAIGSSYKDSYTGDIKTAPVTLWEELGFNDSVIHTDIMSTTDRTVEATLKDGSKKIIYTEGKFTL